MFNPIKAISKPFVVGILGSSLGGPVAAMLMGAGQGGFGPLKGLLKGLQGLFGKSSGSAGAAPSPRPLPFSTSNININVTLNPLGALQGGTGTADAARNAQSGAAQNPFQQLTDALQKLVAALTGGKAGASSAASGGSSASSSAAPSVASGGSGAGVSSAGGAVDRMIDSSGSKIDSLMSQAEKLMASDKMSDQLKGQRMMQQAMRLFEMISKMMEQRSQMQAKAIQAIK